MLWSLIPLIFFLSLLVGSFTYLLLRLRGTHGHIKKEISMQHAALITAGVAIVACAFCLALACVVVFEAYNIRWN